MSIMASLASALAPKLLGRVLGTVEKYFDREVNRNKLEKELNAEILKTFGDLSSAQTRVLEAEIKGEDWLQRNWRPIVALSSFGILVFYALIVPILDAWVGVPVPRTGDLLLEWVMTITLTCIGGYMGGRSLEKIVKTIKNK